MERKTFLKLAKGQSKILRVVNIKKREVVDIEGETEQYTLYSDAAKEALRTLWQADRANPNGPLVGKRLKLTLPEKGSVQLEVVSGAYETKEDEGDVPF